jgi:hypothetical protein
MAMDKASKSCGFMKQISILEDRVSGLTARVVHLEECDCYRWRGGGEVNNRPVGKPQEEGMMNIAANFSLSKKPRFN